MSKHVIPGIDDDTEERELFTMSEWEKMLPSDFPEYKPLGPVCDCGGWKTYGEGKNDTYYHSSWCTILNYWKFKGF